MTIIPGDKIKYEIYLLGQKIIDYFNVSFIDSKEQSFIVTCGHCLPGNANVKNAQIKYTSGFDNKDEPKEIAILVDKNPQLYSNLINNKQLVLKEYIAPNNIIVYNYYQRNLLKCKILSYIDYHLDEGIISINNNWYILNSITKLEQPYYLISGCIDRVVDIQQKKYIINEAKKIFNQFKFSNIDNVNILINTLPGYSGSPWMLETDTEYIHIGTHIGRTLGIELNEKKEIITISYIAYAKPINTFKSYL